MIYRETGQFKANYQDDQALFPIAQDRYVILAVLFVTFAVVPFLLFRPQGLFGERIIERV